MKLYVLESGMGGIRADIISFDESTVCRKVLHIESIDEQLKWAINLIREEKPDKVLIDKIGYSKDFHDRFMNMVSEGNLGFIIDVNGNVGFTNKN